MDAAAGTPPGNSNRPTATGDTTAHPHHAMVAPLGVPVAAALLAGICSCLWLPSLPPWWLAAGLLAPALWSWWRGGLLRLTGAGAVGFALAALHAGHALSLQLPADWERREATVEGRVVGLPESHSRRTAFDFRVDGDDAQPAPLRGRRLQLSWYDDFDGSGTGRERLRAGQRWQLTARVRAPRGLRNPGGFDSEKYALADRVTARGYVREPATARLQSEGGGLHAWREAMSARVAVAVDPDNSRFIRALALGDTRGLDDADWEALRANGLTHLVAISGFHVGLVAGFFALAVAGVWWLWPALGRRCPRPLAAAAGAVAGAALYTAVAGFALPTVRTLLMIAVVAGVRSSRRAPGPWGTLSVAAVAVLVADPLSVLGAGFWLSFLGVAWLMWCLPANGAHRPVQALLQAQGVATVGLLPLGVVLFGQASLVGPLANLIAVPWWSLVVVPLALFGTALEALAAGWGGWAWQAAGWCFGASWPLFEWLAGTPLALWWLPESRWFALPLALAGAFWLLLPRGLPGRPLALLLWLPLLWPDRRLPAHGEAELQVLDVGQGLSVLVRTAGHTLLYDMGPASRDGFDAGERVVVPALRALGVRRIDRAVVSHGDGDHAGGFGAVRRRVPVAQALAPEGSRVPVAGRCVAGEAWTWDGVGFRFLHPGRYFPYLGNEASCVLRVSTAHGTALLPGDIGAVVERELVRRAGEDPDASMDAEVVVVSHHGSGSASDPAFIAATGARFALVSNGHGNRFDHPREEVLERWHGAGADSLQTALGGALRVWLGEGGVALETRRAAHPRLWDANRRTTTTPAPDSAGLSYRPVWIGRGPEVVRARIGQGRRLADDPAAGAHGGGARDHP